MIAGLGGMLYAPQMGIFTPTNMEASASILVVVWVAVGGRGALSGAYPRRIGGESSLQLFYLGKKCLAAYLESGVLAICLGRPVHRRRFTLPRWLN